MPYSTNGIVYINLPLPNFAVVSGASVYRQYDTMHADVTIPIIWFNKLTE